jgi:hypothetical protein
MSHTKPAQINLLKMRSVAQFRLKVQRCQQGIDPFSRNLAAFALFRTLVGTAAPNWRLGSGIWLDQLANPGSVIRGQPKTAPAPTIQPCRLFPALNWASLRLPAAGRPRAVLHWQEIKGRNLVPSLGIVVIMRGNVRIHQYLGRFVFLPRFSILASMKTFENVSGTFASGS